jgi:hypothetical protein
MNYGTYVDMAVLLCKECIMHVTVCLSQTTYGIASMLRHDFVRKGNYAYKLSGICSMSKKPLCMFGRRVLHCAGSGEGPYIKLFRWHSSPLSYACQGYTPTFIVTKYCTFTLTCNVTCILLTAGAQGHFAYPVDSHIISRL